MTIPKNRLLVAALLLPPLCFLVIWLPAFPFTLLIAVLIVAVQYEYYGLFYQNASPATPGGRYIGLGLGLLLTGYIWQGTLSTVSITLPAHGLLSIFVIITFTYYLFCFTDIRNAFVEPAVVLMGVAYPAGLLTSLILIRALPDGEWLILFLLMVVWGSDAMAYYVGSFLGKRKLYPIVSPHKTVEGAIGGMVGSGMACLLGKWILLPVMQWRDVIALTLLLGIAGQVGDLVESLLKRSVGVKDSSGLIPAHGGLLDKVDSLAFAAPVFYYYASVCWTMG